jgi:hypothetical protein
VAILLTIALTRADGRFKPANVPIEERAAELRGGVFFFRSKLILPGG